MAHPGRGDQLDHGLGHAEAGAQDGDHGHLLAGDGGRVHLLQRRLDALPGHGQIARHLIAHQEGDLLQQLAEEDGGGALVAHDGELVLDQRMIEDMEIRKLAERRCHAAPLIVRMRLPL